MTYDHPLGKLFVMLLAPHRERCRKGEQLFISVDEMRREEDRGTRICITRKLGGTPDRHASGVIEDREMLINRYSKGATVEYVASVIRYLVGLVTERYVAFRLRHGAHWGRERLDVRRVFRSRIRTRRT